MMTSLRIGLLWCVSLLVVTFVPARAAAQNCFGRTTLAEAMDHFDAVVLANSRDGAKQLEVIEVLFQPNSIKLQAGSKLELSAEQLEQFQVSPEKLKKKGDRFVLFGTLRDDGSITWTFPAVTTIHAWQYVKKIPRTNHPAMQRLPFFLKHLEDDDSIVLTDCSLELSAATNDQLVELARETPPERLRVGLANPKCADRGLYGVMLGMKGNADDTKLLERIILEPAEDFRPYIGGIMKGYLLLSREQGLSLLEEKILRDKTAPFSEMFAVIDALRFIWQYGDNRIEPDRLRQSMRILLERPELADIVIPELARMKDWSVQDRLIELYEVDAYNIPSIKRAIMRFTLAASTDTGIKKVDVGAAGGPPVLTPREKLPAHVVRAQKCLEELEKRDPKTFHEAKRFFVPK